MRRRAWVFAVALIVVVIAARVASRRPTLFDSWPRFTSMPGSVPRGAITHVKVIDERGPVAGAELVLTRDGGTEELTVGADGSRALATPGEVAFFATRGDRVSRVVFIGDEVPPDGLVMPLVDRAARLEVKVVGPDGAPMAGAVVRAGLRSAVTGADGVAHLAALPEGVFVATTPMGSQTAFSWAALVEGETTRVLIDLQETCVASGLVTRADDHRPVANAAISMLSLIDATLVSETRTNELGQFELRVRRTAAFVVRAEAPGLNLAELALAPECPPLHFELREGGSALVQVLDFDGRPAPGANLRLLPSDSLSDAWFFTGQTDSLGRYQTPREVLGGAWLIDASLGGQVASETLELTTDGGVVTLEFDEPSRRVTGRVVDAKSGAPIAGAAIGPFGTSGPDGRFDVLAFGAGTITRKVTAAGYEPGRFTSKAGGEDVLVRLDRLAWATGRVVDERGQPLTEFFVDGARQLSPDGRFVVEASSRTLTFSAWRFEEVERDAAPDLGTVVLRRAPAVEVTALAPDGGRVAAEVMFAATPPASAIASLRLRKLDGLGSTDEAGRARVYPPSRDGCLLVARFPLIPSGCEPNDGGTVVLQLGEPGGFDGKVRGPDGRLGEARVDLDEDTEAATFSREGQFSLWPVTPGPHRLRTVLPTGTLHQREVLAVAGARRTLVLSEAGGGQLRVRVHPNDTQPISVDVTQGTARWSRTFAPDGSAAGFVDFDFFGLEERVVEILVQQGERHQSKQLVATPSRPEVKVDLSPGP